MKTETIKDFATIFLNGEIFEDGQSYEGYCLFIKNLYLAKGMLNGNGVLKAKMCFSHSDLDYSEWTRSLYR